MRLSKYALVLLFAAVPVRAELSASSPKWPGVQVQFVSGLEPAAKLSSPLPGFVIVSEDRISRILQDDKHRTYFGYDLVVEQGRKARIFQLRIEPLSLKPEQLEKVIGSTWTRLSLPRYPVIPEISVGDTIAVDLLVNPSTGQKIIDYITLATTNAKHPKESESSRDFSLADVPLELESPQLRVNGSLIEGTDVTHTSVSGAVAWFYLANHGRFILSLIPAPELGFHRAGEVVDRTLIFKFASTEYRLECSRRILPSAGLFNIYVLDDPTWRPQGLYANDLFVMGTADKAEWLVGN